MSMSPIKSMEVFQRLISGKAVDVEALVEAAKTAMGTLKQSAEAEQKRIIVDQTCSSCQRWERDYGTKAGGWCPIPVRHSCQIRKYTRQSTKACLKYIQKEETHNDRDQ